MHHPGHRRTDNPWTEEAPDWAIEIGLGLHFIIERIIEMPIITDKLLADVAAQTTVLNSLVLFV